MKENNVEEYWLEEDLLEIVRVKNTLKEIWAITKFLIRFVIGFGLMIFLAVIYKNSWSLIYSIPYIITFPLIIAWIVYGFNFNK